MNSTNFKQDCIALEDENIYIPTHILNEKNKSKQSQDDLELDTINIEHICQQLYMLGDLANIAIIGPRGIGKTTLIKNISYHFYRNYDIGNIYLFTDSNIKDYDDIFLNSDFTLVKHNDLLNIIETQKKNPYNRILLILDNNELLNNSSNNIILTDLFTNHRQYNINIISSYQNTCNLSCSIKCNFNFILVSKLNVDSNRKKFYNSFIHTIKYKQFNNLMDNLTNYKFFVINFLASRITNGERNEIKKTFKYLMLNKVDEYIDSNKLLELSKPIEMNKEINVNLQNPNINQILKKIDKNNKLILKLVEENQKLLGVMEDTK